ncbi:MAG TPA: hypothetical protein VM490_08025 [Armatimonadaceae bacterium]|nr:hypothetical protein [Armatimonadaceae bacterium]
MLSKRLSAVFAAVLVAAFFGSRLPISSAQPAPSQRALVAMLDDKPLTDAQVRRFVQAGTPALDAVLNDFARSSFVRDARRTLAPGAPLGRAFDSSVYASNVVKVAEGFGMVGVDRLLRRMDPAVVKAYGLDTPAFRKLGAATVKPLLTAEVIKGASASNSGRVIDWVKDNYVWEEVQEINPGGPVENFATAVAGGVVAGLVVIAVEKAYDHFVKKEHDLMRANVAKVKAANMKQMLSPAARAGLLKELDPKVPAAGNPAVGF